MIVDAFALAIILCVAMFFAVRLATRDCHRFEQENKTLRTVVPDQKIVHRVVRNIEMI